MRCLPAAIIAAAAMLAAACEAQQAPAPPPPAPAAATAPAQPASLPAINDNLALTQAAAQVETLIGNARCDADAQCRTIARGSKACGGPTSYSAWSTQTTDARSLEAAVAKEKALVEAANRRSGMMSNCMMLADPGARCEANRCVTSTSALPR